MSDVAREIKGRLSTDYYKRLSCPISSQNSRINQNSGEDIEAHELEVKTTSSNNKQKKFKNIKLIAVVVLVIVIVTVVIAAPVAVHVRNKHDKDD